MYNYSTSMSAELSSFAVGYVVFKHVWTESDTGVREYEFFEIFSTAAKAEKFVRKYYKKTKVDFHFGGTVDIDVVVFCKNIDTSGEKSYPWKWSEEFESYIWSADNGYFKWFKELNHDKAFEKLTSKYPKNKLEYVSIGHFGDLSVDTPIPNY
jgi:hypothetical protein